jgi:ABC-type sugar transport system ATPase subunit
MPDEEFSIRPPLLSLKGLTRRFGGVVALGGVDFELRAGEIHALLGENGAGKSTLIKILGGIVRPDAGTIELEGRPVEIRDVADANQLGIRLIHQDLSLAPNLSVAENILLGREPVRLGFLLDRRRLFNLAAEQVEDLGFSEIGSVREKVSNLSVARQQLVEIARALAVQARILVLDEPTASLSQHEAETLFLRLGRLRAQGVGIIYISHRLEEIRRLADRVTVFRDGLSVGTHRVSEVDRSMLVRLMVGRDLREAVRHPGRSPGKVVLSARRLCNEHVHDVSFELRCGETLGFAGLIGSGRSELARVLFGIDRLQSGTIEVGGRPLVLKSPRDARAAGIVMVPEDRKIQSLVMTGSVGFNLALPWTRDWVSGCWIHRRRRAAIVERALRGFAIKADQPEQAVDKLSGGNQQKVAVSRWMEHPPRILILDEPTRGIDVGARAEMYALLDRLVAEGIAVILISSDMTELMSHSNRLVIYRGGRILREASSSQTNVEEVMGELMNP